jgi:hypothetical protein
VCSSRRECRWGSSARPGTRPGPTFTCPVLTYPQEESWFQSFAGTAFSWQDQGGHQPLPVAQFASAPVFEVVQKPVFEVVTSELAPADDVVEFTLDS